MSDRGMKKWLPFNALIEQNQYLEKFLYEKNKIRKPQVSVEQAKKIDRILKEHATNELVFKVYIDGYLYTFKSKIKNINLNSRVIEFEDFYLPIKDIIDIDDPDGFDSIC